MSARVSNAALAQAAAEAARAVAGVLDLDDGAVGEFSTYGTSGRVPGVRATTTPPAVSLRLVVQYGRVINDVAGQVREQVRQLGGRVLGGELPAVDVHVVDVRDQTVTPTAPPALPQETAPAHPAPGQEAPWPS